MNWKAWSLVGVVGVPVTTLFFPHNVLFLGSTSHRGTACYMVVVVPYSYYKQYNKVWFWTPSMWRSEGIPVTTLCCFLDPAMPLVINSGCWLLFPIINKSQVFQTKTNWHKVRSWHKASEVCFWGVCVLEWTENSWYWWVFFGVNWK